MLLYEHPRSYLAQKVKGRQTRLIQDWLAGRLGDAGWFGGEQFGWADTAVVPLVGRSMSFGLGPDPAGKLGLWHSRARAAVGGGNVQRGRGRRGWRVAVT